jgi:hypothetical protein
MVEVNVWGAFAAIGFTHDNDQIPSGLVFHEEKFRQSPGFGEAEEIKTRFESLSKRQHESKFGWMDKPE